MTVDLDSRPADGRPELLLAPEPFQEISALNFQAKTRGEHELYWWRRCGFALAAMLQNAGYPQDAQLRILDFFANRIAPFLGPPAESAVAGGSKSGPRPWQSFMTDDHNPVELSWDWGTGGARRPTVRFSVEPVGLDAGTCLDPANQVAPAMLRKSVLDALPTADARWFDHFSGFFGRAGYHRRQKQQQPGVAGEDHATSIFWAFDLSHAGGITSKAYFFPRPLAEATGEATLEVVGRAIASAPVVGAAAADNEDEGGTLGRLESLALLESYSRELSERGLPPLEVDMLAIDLVPPPTRGIGGGSRLKLYCRSRRTSFASVRDMLTLGGRLLAPGAGGPGVLTEEDMRLGLARLRRLWDDLFAQHGVADDVALPEVRHRTAGILYYLDFRTASGAGASTAASSPSSFCRPPPPPPKVKVYLPVRHYAASDWQIMSAVGLFTGGGGSDAIAYAKTLFTIAKPMSLLDSKGIHTYIACSIEAGGLLRVVSYLNLQEGKIRDEDME